MNTVEQPMYGWNTRPWKKFQRNVFKLQKRIYQASQRGDVKTVRKCGRFFKMEKQWKWITSYPRNGEEVTRSTTGNYSIDIAMT